jgi:hypothetical protein
MDLGVMLVGEGVLAVELDLIDLPRREPVDEIAQRLHRGNLVARNVEHDASHGEVGVVADGARRERSVVEPRKLRKGAPGVEESGVVTGDNVHAIVVDRQLVSLGRQRAIDPLALDSV